MKTKSQIIKLIGNNHLYVDAHVDCLKIWQCFSWLEVIAWKSSPAYISGGLYCVCWPLVH